LRRYSKRKTYGKSLRQVESFGGKIRVIEESKLYDPLKSIEMCLLLNVVVPKEF
jgi:hypothetical protein